MFALGLQSKKRPYKFVSSAVFYRKYFEEYAEKLKKVDSILTPLTYDGYPKNAHKAICFQFHHAHCPEV